MDPKLKALKVVDLKALLTKAGQTIPAKANKPELISRVLASPEAIAAYNAEHGADDLLAPPEEVDWNADEPVASTEVTKEPPLAATETPVAAAATTTPKPASKAAETTPATPSKGPEANKETTEVDAEEEQKRKRAERFGIKYEPKKPTATATNKLTTQAAAPPVDAETLKARAARFGIAVNEGTGQRLDQPLRSSRKRPSESSADPKEAKRPKRAPKPNAKTTAVEAPVDPEEQKRREQRAARFGTGTKPAS